MVPQDKLCSMELYSYINLRGEVMDGLHLAQDKDQWRVLMKIMNSGFRKRVGNFIVRNTD